MSAGSVLKSGVAAGARVMLRGQAMQQAAAADEPGVWITHRELDALRAELFEQGRLAGEQHGKQQAEAAALQQARNEATRRLERELKDRQARTAAEQADKWRGLAAALAQQLQALRTELEGEVTEWAFAAITRLLGTQPQAHVAAAVRQVLDDAALPAPLTVGVHPGDLAALDADRAANPSAWPQDVRFEADAQVTSGGCRVRSGVQTLDARLDVQLALLREALDAARQTRAASPD